MKILHTTLLILSVLASGSAVASHAVTAVQADGNQPISSNSAALAEETPAQQSISAANLQIETDPKKVQAYNELALAYLRRSRESADPKYLIDAGEALAQGLKLEPDNFQLQRTEVALLLACHEYTKAREKATAMHRRTPDDVMTYGYIAEADIELGNYPEAETNAQWMMNMRPYNTPGLLIGARLRALYGNAHGAIDFLNRAYSQTSPTEVEEQAWLSNQIASMQIEAGQNDAAARSLERAEQLFPGYACTMENLARLRMAQNRAKDAASLLVQATQIDHDPHILFMLANAQEAAGEIKAAHATYAEFEKLASAPETATDASKLDLILMYSGSAASAPKALALAQQEIAARQDIWTLNAYAWALYCNAKFEEADAAIQKAMVVGVQSAQIFDHAGHIAQKLNRSADAVRYFTLALQSNPSSEYAVDARKSVSSAAAADAAEIKLQPTEPIASAQVSASPETALTERMAAFDKPAATSKSVNIEATPSAPIFAPIPDTLLTPHPTGTAHSIRTAQSAVTRQPKDATAYAALGAAYFQQARETGDVADYDLAEQSLSKSLDLVFADFSADAALGTMSEVCMGEHRFADALTYARKALSLGTGDVSPFAIIGDAYADMGEYDKAADAYGRLTPRDMTLSPRAAYARDSRISYLRFISGDTAGAIGLMKTAVSEGLEAQLPSENLAWLYYELGEFHSQAGDLASADSGYMSALTIHPGDYRALAALGKLRANNGRYAEAIVLYQKAIAIVPMPIYIAELGDLYAKSGNAAEAQKQYALVEYIGLLGHINQVLHNRDLAIFYADHDMKLNEALDLARKELEVRHDVYTWDALAWVQYKNGNLAEAAKASEKALQCGTRDALLLFHAGMIAERQGQQKQARNMLNQALEINPHFHLLYADTAQQQLTLLTQASAKEGQANRGR